VPPGDLAAGIDEDDIGARVAAEHDVRHQLERELSAVALRDAQRPDRRHAPLPTSAVDPLDALMRMNPPVSRRAILFEPGASRQGEGRYGTAPVRATRR
jgi:hypothetical protein